MKEKLLAVSLLLILLNSCTSPNKSKKNSYNLATITENNEEVILYTVDNKRIKGDLFGFKQTKIMPGKHKITAKYRWINSIPISNVNIQTSSSSGFIQEICFFAKEGVGYEVRANPNTQKVYVSGGLKNLFESEDATIPCN